MAHKFEDFRPCYTLERELIQLDETQNRGGSIWTGNVSDKLVFDNLMNISSSVHGFLYVQPERQ